MKVLGFILCSLVGFVIGHFLLEGAAAAYASVLISYHLYLVILLLVADQKKGMSLSLGMTVLMHGAFLVVLVGLPYLRDRVPFFTLISMLVPALAPFEVKWLFSKDEEKKDPFDAPSEMPTATIEDHEAFREYLRQGIRPFRKSGLSIDKEFNLWLADRAKKKAEADAAAASAASANSENPAPTGTTVQE